MTPPLRFLIAVIGVWALARTAVLAPWPASAEQPAVPLASGKRTLAAEPRAMQGPSAAVAPPEREGRAVDSSAAGTAPLAKPVHGQQRRTARSDRSDRSGPVGTGGQTARLAAVTAFARHPDYLLPQQAPAVRDAPLVLGGRPAGPAFAQAATPSRWSFSAWLLARRGGSPALASAGTLGASQAGARIGYRIAGPPAAPLSLTTRLSSPARSLSGTEAALGVEWQPSRRLPIRLAAERRQAVGRDGRSAFAVLAHGGVSELPVAAGFRLDAYGQAGVVGARSRHLFADGAARLTLPVDGKGRIAIGAGAWAAAQPGVSRIDIGPSATLRLPGASVSLDWRARVGGDADPASGPALTVSTGF